VVNASSNIKYIDMVVINLPTIVGDSKSNQVILKALKTYGMIVADNGSDWFLSGAPNPKWDDGDLNKLKQIKGSDFEVVDSGPIKTTY
jgi:hypothetical protein